MTDALSPAADQAETAPPPTAYIAVTGGDAATFLDGLLTVNVSDLPAAPALTAPGQTAAGIRHGALLSPQGKIQHALIIHALPREGDGFILQTCGGDLSDRLVKRLTLMKLRADVVIAPADDKQLAQVGMPEVPGGPDDRGVDRLRTGMPVQGIDFGFEEVFPTDVNLDLLGGVDYHKGCFVGQEVVSRMARRSTIRKRTFILQSTDNQPLPHHNTDVVSPSSDRLGGVTSSAVDGDGGAVALAVIRTDRLLEVGGLEATVMVGDVPCTIALPPYADGVALGLVPAGDDAVVGSAGGKRD